MCLRRVTFATGVELKKAMMKSRVPWGASYTPTVWSEEEGGSDGAGAHSASVSSSFAEFGITYL